MNFKPDDSDIATSVDEVDRSAVAFADSQWSQFQLGSGGDPRGAFTPGQMTLSFINSLGQSAFGGEGAGGIRTIYAHVRRARLRGSFELPPRLGVMGRHLSWMIARSYEQICINLPHRAFGFDRLAPHLLMTWFHLWCSRPLGREQRGLDTGPWALLFRFSIRNNCDLSIQGRFA